MAFALRRRTSFERMLKIVEAAVDTFVNVVLGADLSLDRTVETLGSGHDFRLDLVVTVPLGGSL